tara:strand:- start:60 stop:383 length:324 start_codon:yes stop_codon:yes gene_type:complete
MKALTTTIQVKHLKVLVKAANQLQSGREQGQFDFSIDLFTKQENAIKHANCAILNAEGNKKKRRDTINGFNIVLDPEAQAFNAERNAEEVENASPKRKKFIPWNTES